MRKIKLYIAQSLDGKIARPDGTIDWLEEFPLPLDDDYGYDKFCESVDTVIMGHKTYKQLLTFPIDYPYSKMENFVLTRDKNKIDDEQVHFINSEHINFVKQLKQKTGKHIWLIGGAQVNALFMQNELIDEIILFVIPVLIGQGIALFEPCFEKFTMKLTSTKLYLNGVIEYRFSKL